MYKIAIDKDLLAQDVRLGLNTLSLAKKYKCSYNTILRRCREFGLGYPIRRTKAILDTKSLSSNVAKGMTAPELAKLYGCSVTTIRDTCKRKGLSAPVRDMTVSRARRKTFETRYFKTINTREKAYIVGFISADGGRDRQWGIKIKLHIKDRDILETFSKCLNCSYQPRIVEGGHYMCLALYDVDMVRDLERYGITERKTRTIEFAKNIPDAFVLDYMRGVFDGDGSFCKNRRGAKLVTGSLNFRNGFLDWYSKRYSRLPWTKSEGTSKFRFSFNNADAPFIHDMYKDAPISLNRKQSLYNQWYSTLD